MHQGTSQEFQYDLNPYDSFMRNHLKHYGYYTGRNETYRSSTSHHGCDSWEQANSFHVSDQGSDTDYENQALRDKLDADNQFSQDQKRTTQLTFSYQSGKMIPKLREPRGLYALSKEPGPQQAPRWPADMEVLPEDEQPQHISALPPGPEPLNQPTGYEQMPEPLAEGEGRVVYYNPPTVESYFLRSRVGGSRAGCPKRAVKLKSSEDTTLLFESRFESGNLMKATQVSEFEYELLLRHDLYTDKHTQWFYFRVQNARKGVRYRFTITNLMKPGSLYNNGMRPLLYSERAALTKKAGWKRCGEDIKYYKNYIRRGDVKGDKSLYSLTWTVTFPYDDDTYYLAHCYPYTYSDLQQYLLNLSNDPVRSRFCKQRILCRSLAGNMVYILTITSPSQTPLDAKMKRAVVVTARVHPGETNASWMMKGFLDYLTSNSHDAKLLRDAFVFKIVPMLNPDGVIVGNYRCSLAGRDLNRNYKSVLKDSFPSVAHTKAMIKKLIEEREVIAYCDLHGHSRKQNVFMYGCENKKNASKRLRERVFPVIMGKNASDKFSFQNCKFKVQKNKEGTGRVVMWQMGIMNSYTMEATFCGSMLGQKRGLHFDTADFEAMGYHFCDSLLDYCDPNEKKCNVIHADLLEKLRQDILRHLERTGTPLPHDGEIDLNEDFLSEVESSTTGSDSSADDGLPVHLLALAPKFTKKKKLKSRKERDKKRTSSEKPKDKEKEQVKEKPSSDRLSGRTKDLDGDKKPSSPKKDKQHHYRGDRSTLHSAGKERHAHHGRYDGVPVFAQERCDDRNLRKGFRRPKLKSEYLEALTNAYLMSGVLKPANQDVPSFRYSAGSVGIIAKGMPMAHVDGLCPHHEKALAEQIVASQLASLQFADDKFDWSHHAMDTAKAIESLRQRDISSPQRRREFNNHMITMSALHQTQRPLNDYIRNTAQSNHTINRPHTAKRTVHDPVKDHPSLFDEQSQDKISVKKGHSSSTISLKSRCPSETNFSVFDGQDKSSTHGSSRGRTERPTSHKTGMDRSPSQALVRISSTNTSSSCSPSDPVIYAIPTGADKLRGQAKRQLFRSYSVASHRRSSSQPVADHDIDSTSQLNQDVDKTSSGTSQPVMSNNRETPTKIHCCTTEATPTTDLTSFSNHRTVSSSHHFKRAQNFYGNPVITQQERAKTVIVSSAGSKSSCLGKNLLDNTVTSFRASLPLVGDGEKKESLDTQLNANNNSDEVHDGTREKIVGAAVLLNGDTLEDSNSSPRVHNVHPVHPHGDTHTQGNHKTDNKEVLNHTSVPDSDCDRDDVNINSVPDSRMESDSQVSKQSNVHNILVNNGHTVKGEGDNVDSDNADYKSNFKMLLGLEFNEQQPISTQRSFRRDLDLSDRSYKQGINLIKGDGKCQETLQTQGQYTKDLKSSRSHFQSNMGQCKADVSLGLVDSMHKYSSIENPDGTLYPHPPSPSSTSNNYNKNTQHSPRHTNSRISKMSPREYDLSENLSPERFISPQATQRYVRVSRLGLQIRGLADVKSPELNCSSNYDFPPSPGSPGSGIIPKYHMFKQEHKELDAILHGQSYGEPFVSPTRKQFESQHKVSGHQSSKHHGSSVLNDCSKTTSSEDTCEIEPQGSVAEYKTATMYLRNSIRKK